MYNPDELMQEFKQFTLLEKIALETGEEDEMCIRDRLCLVLNVW